MTGPDPTCPDCGAPLEAGVCNVCGSGDDDLDATRRRIEETRASLSAWRERVARRLEEYERRRDLLQSDTARRAANAPTQRLDDRADGPPAGADSQAEPAAGSAAALDALFATPPAPHAPLTPPPEEATTLGEIQPRPPAGRPELEDIAATQATFLRAPDRSMFDEDEHETLAVQTVDDEDVDWEASPSLVVHAAAILLDVLLLMAVPAMLLLAPLSRATPELGVVELLHGERWLLGPLCLAPFVLLETLYVGAFGRTPAQRLLGLRTIDLESREIPSFRQALLRAVALPILVLAPPVQRLFGLRTISER